jgi:hypothetical protein
MSLAFSPSRMRRATAAAFLLRSSTDGHGCEPFRDSLITCSALPDVVMRFCGPDHARISTFVTVASSSRAPALKLSPVFQNRFRLSRSFLTGRERSPSRWGSIPITPEWSDARKEIAESMVSSFVPFESRNAGHAQNDDDVVRRTSWFERGRDQLPLVSKARTGYCEP